MNPSNPQTTAGTPEETSLIVRLLEKKWIVENGLGESVGEAEDRDAAVEIARDQARNQRASGISVLNEDGSVDQTFSV
jgi:hypothetical protein